MCSVCMHSRKQHALEPCGHAFCEACSSRVTVCPVCKQGTTRRIRVFLGV